MDFDFITNFAGIFCYFEYFIPAYFFQTINGENHVLPHGGEHKNTLNLLAVIRGHAQLQFFRLPYTMTLTS